MQYISYYDSPLGRLLLAADEEGLVGAWFEGQKYFARGLAKECEERETPTLAAAKRWLDVYFSGREPDISVPLHLSGTAFQKDVWQILCGIPYGETTTYGKITKKMEERDGRACVSARAVGDAVGHNPVSVIVPCHRVVGADGRLTGYAGGLERKARLLALEKAGGKPLHFPSKGEAL